MKPLLVATIIGVAIGGGAVQPKVVSDFLADLYPKDPARRQALDRCILTDVNFNRLDAAARDACYRHALAAPASLVSPLPPGGAPNQVDLGRAASRGSSPANDVRLLQQTDGWRR